MKLVRIEDDPRFFFVVVGEELLPFDIVVPADQRIMMPMQAEEYLPALTAMLSRGDLLQRQHTRLVTAAPDQFKPFRRKLAECALAPPVRPGTVREIASPFAEHASSARYPHFRYMNNGCMQTPTKPISLPSYATAVLPLVQIAAVIGAPVVNVSVTDADQYIAGFAMLTTLVEPKLRAEEAHAGTGPGKSSDFAAILGPALVTPDELSSIQVKTRDQGISYLFTTKLTVNDGWNTVFTARIPWTFAQMIAYASQGTNLFAGDLITVQVLPETVMINSAEGDGGLLRAGDTLSVEIDGIGSHTVAL